MQFAAQRQSVFIDGLKRVVASAPAIAKTFMPLLAFPVRMCRIDGAKFSPLAFRLWILAMQQ
jgi:hypothetical protein